LPARLEHQPERKEEENKRKGHDAEEVVSAKKKPEKVLNITQHSFPYFTLFVRSFLPRQTPARVALSA
jgi:hypothetical protein